MRRKNQQERENQMKKLFAIAIAAAMSLLMVGTAQGAGETVTASTTVEARKGSLFQTFHRPANLRIRADVHTNQPLILPMKNTKITFPAGVTFNPNPRMPVCTDQKLNEQSALGNPEGVLASCARSVIGTGTSTIYLAKQAAAPLADPFLIIFNAGKSARGNAKIKIYGYSKGTGVGILMTAELRNRVLDVAIPVLSFDSAVQYYQFDMPGGLLNPPDVPIRTRGLDANYVRAICPASGRLVTDAEFILGERNATTGADTGPETSVTAPTSVQNCRGAKGKPRYKVVVRGPRAVRNGRKGVFRVVVRNNGTALARGVRVIAPGGRANAGNIPAGRAKVVRVRATVRGRVGTRAPVRFTVRGSGANGRGVARVIVRR